MALDVIVDGMVDDFKSRYGLNELSKDKAFEYLVNFLAVTKYQEDAFSEKSDLNNLVVDEKSQFGLDAIAFIVNGNLVTTKDDIIQYSKSKILNVQILFIQSKTSNKLETGDLLKTIEATKNFFLNFGAINEKNDNIINCKDIWDEIHSFSNYKYCSSESPLCHIVYAVDTDNFGDTELVNSLIQNNEKELLEKLPDIRRTKIEIWGKQRLINFYNEITNSNECNITFNNYIELSSINGVSSSYIGFLPGSEYLKILTSENGTIRRRIFYENVRDYQGDSNTVNQEISKTIKNQKMRDQFILLNNGVTIISKKITPLGSKQYELKDFQIVNGCQTSNVLFELKDDIKDIQIPVKIIATEDTDLITNIVKATNRQTQVPEETFVVLSDYHKNIQIYFSQMQGKMPLDFVYERRAGEFVNLIGDKYKINLHNLVRATTAIFFQDPHMVYNNNPAIIIKNRSEKIFNRNQPLEMYYIAAYLFIYLQKLENSQSLEKGDFINKYYILTVVYCLITQNKNKREFDSKDFKKELNECLDELKRNKIKDYFSKASSFVQHQMNKYFKEYSMRDNEIRKLSDFKDYIFENLTEEFLEE